jgi:hypothetical protein
MAWADNYIALLREGKTISFRPRGNSMTPKIKSGQLCTVRPYYGDLDIKVGDVVLCKVRGAQYLHLVKAIKPPKNMDSLPEYQIGNIHGRINGWCSENGIYGILIKVEP